MDKDLERLIADIIQDYLDRDTVHIEYHRETLDMTGNMARAIIQQVEDWEDTDDLFAHDPDDY